MDIGRAPSLSDRVESGVFGGDFGAAIMADAQDRGGEIRAPGY
jgi:hypothetical protein